MILIVFCPNPLSPKLRICLGEQKLPIDVIVDSGAAVNLIDAKLWKRLKKQNITCKSEKNYKEIIRIWVRQTIGSFGKIQHSS